MAEAGMLDKNDRVELIHGEIIKMSPIGSKHSGHVNRINALFSQLAGNRAIISIQKPIILGDYSEPEPDIVILKYRDDYYTKEHPRPENILLIIEVADTSLYYDREIKIPMFANAGISEFWIVNLENEQVEVYKKPTTGRYAEQEIFKRGDSIHLEILGKSLNAGDMLV